MSMYSDEWIKLRLAESGLIHEGPIDHKDNNIITGLNSIVADENQDLRTRLQVASLLGDDLGNASSLSSIASFRMECEEESRNYNYLGEYLLAIYQREFPPASASGMKTVANAKPILSILPRADVITPLDGLTA